MRVYANIFGYRFGYRFGFNGQEKDNEVSGEGNSLNFGARIYDSRLARWMSTDPLQHEYAALSPYVFSLNSPNLFKDPDGKDAVVTIQKDENGGGRIIISSTVYITGNAASKFNADLYTKKASKIYKSGSYTNDAGETYTIDFDVKFEYAEDKSKIKLQDGDNILEYNDKDIRTHVQCSYTVTTLEGSLTEVHRLNGTKGEISADDAVGADYTQTLHEVLHFLGLSDRYIDVGGTKKSTPDKDFEEDIMGKYGATKIDQLHYDNYGKKLSELEEGKSILKEKVDTRTTDGSIIGGSADGKRAITTEEIKRAE